MTNGPNAASDSTANRRSKTVQGVRPKAPWLLRATLFAVMALPPTLVLKPLGASGSLPEVLALLVFAMWLGRMVLGLGNSVGYGHPARAALLTLVLVSFASYIQMFLGVGENATAAGRASADRWMLLLAASAGIAFMTTETIRTLDDALPLIRWLLAGANVCAFIALVQWAGKVNPMDWYPAIMPGFADNGGSNPFQLRGALMRVGGTTTHPIELGVVTAMLIPLAVWRAIHDPRGSKIAHWAGAIALLAANALTVSRSALLGLAVVAVFTVPALPRQARRWAAVAVPLAVAGMFVAAPGLLSTLFSTATVNSSDPSISWRLDDYPRAEHLVVQRPWLGTGPGNFIPATAKDIFDNQYLLSAVTLGLIGMLAFAAYVTVPAFAALVAARRARRDESLRLLAAGASAGCFIAVIDSGTFDSLAFPVFALLFPFFLGLSGSVWRLAYYAHPPAEFDAHSYTCYSGGRD